MPLGAAEQERIANDQYSMMATATAEPVYGAPAVDKAAEQGQMAGADSAIAPSENAADVVKIVGAHTFVKSNGIWMDTAFDPDSMQTIRVSFLSDDYFALSGARPELAAAFALGSRVIAMADGIAYEVVDGNEPSQPIQIPPTLTPESGASSNPGNGTPSTPNSNNPCASGLLVFVPFGLVLILRRSKFSSSNK
jgi:hypothetical protein